MNLGAMTFDLRFFLNFDGFWLLKSGLQLYHFTELSSYNQCHPLVAPSPHQWSVFPLSPVPAGEAKMLSLNEDTEVTSREKYGRTFSVAPAFSDTSLNNRNKGCWKNSCRCRNRRGRRSRAGTSRRRPVFGRRRIGGRRTSAQVCSTSGAEAA